MALREPPSVWHVVRTIAWRDLARARDSRLVRFLGYATLALVAVFAALVVGKLWLQKLLGSHANLDWDPVVTFVRAVRLPASLIAFLVAAPAIAMERAQRALLLYSTRPVRPADYVAGKALAAAMPIFAFVLVPGVLMALVQWGIDPSVHLATALATATRIAIDAAAFAVPLAAMGLAASSVVRSTRAAIVLAFVLYAVPTGVGRGVWGVDGALLGVPKALEVVHATLFQVGHGAQGGTRLALAVASLAGWSLAGLGWTWWQMRREMTP